MTIQQALDWQDVSRPLMDQMRSAPYSTRKDLARMLGHIEGLVQELGSEEVEMRRSRKSETATQQRLLQEIAEAINQFNQYVMLAHLMGG
jgi:hypothetical protein